MTRTIMKDDHKRTGTGFPFKELRKLQELARDLEKIREARAQAMPTEKDALNVMANALQRLKDLGWKDAIYCPKDGSTFLVIEVGSTGIHEGYYSGEWPDGHWWIHDPEDGDEYPSRPILWKMKGGKLECS